MRVLLVRHAHAGERGAWPGDDLERELSELGRRRSDALVALLRDLLDGGVDDVRVTSSRAVRCVATVTPFADDHGREVETEPLLLEGVDPDRTLDWLASRDVPTVACSHGDVIGAVVERLVDAGVVDRGDARWPKGSTWALDVTDGEVVAAAYHGPPSLGPTVPVADGTT